MAQNFDKIMDLLNDMERTNSANVQSLDRLLSDISAKLEASDSYANSGILSAFANEIKDAIDKKYSVTLTKFEDIEKALRAVYTTQNELAKNNDMREIFEIFTKNVNNFYTEAKQEKAILTSVEARLSELINNKSDKEDIIRTVALLRKDFENINYAYKNIIDDINTNLKSIISSIVRLDPLKTNDNSRAQVESIYNSVNSIVIQLHDFELKNIKLEQILNKVATSEDLKVTTGYVESLLEKADVIEQKINKLSQDEFGSLNEKTDVIVSEAKELKQALAKVVNNIEDIPDTKVLEESLRGLYSRIENLNNDIDNSNVKGDVFDVNSKLSSLKDELFTVKSIVSDLSEIISSKISESAKTVFEQDGVDILKALEEIPTKLDFENIFNKTKNIEDMLSDTDFGEQKAGINFVSTSSETLTRKTEDIETNLMSISDYIHGNLPLSLEYIKEQLNLIKTSLDKSRSLTKEVIPSSINDDSLTVKYVDDVKNSTRDFSLQPELFDKLMDIQDSLVNYNTHSESRYSSLMQKIEEFEDKISKINLGQELSSGSTEELVNLKSSLESMQHNLDNQVKTSDDTLINQYQLNISNFLSAKLKELYVDLDKLTSASEDRINQGFAYSTELLEEKTEAILNFIREIKADKSDDSISSVSTGLSDFKEELSLLNTDISDNLAEKTENIIKEFAPIRDMIGNLHFEDYVNDIKAKIDEIHTISSEGGNFSSSLEDLYQKVSENIINTENKLKDFVLSDTDSLIIKMDNLREYMEKALKSIVPPEPKKMRELYDFVANIGKFKKEQADLFKNLTSDISKKHNELKSMISVAMNHDDIISAIDNLKHSIGKKIQKLGQGVAPVEAGAVAEFDDSEYTEVLEDLRKDYRHFSGIIENLSDKNSDIENVVNILSDKIESLMSVNKKDEEEDDEFSISEDEPSNFDFMQALDLLKDDINGIKDYVTEILEIEKDDTPIIDVDGVVNSINTKIENVLETMKENWLKEIKSYLNSRNLEPVIQSINNKLDYMMMGNNEAELIENMNKTLENRVASKIKSLNAKLDVIASGEELEILTDISGAIDDVSGAIENVNTRISNLHSKIDNIPNTPVNVPELLQDNSKFDDLGKKIDNLQSKIDSLPDISENFDDAEKFDSLGRKIDDVDFKIDYLQSKIDNLPEQNEIESDDAEKFDSLGKKIDDVDLKIEHLHSKIDNIPTSSPVITEEGTTDFSFLNKAIEDVDYKLSESEEQISSMLETLSKKIDDIPRGESSSNIEDSVIEIKDLITEQKSLIENLEPSEKIEAFRKCLDELTDEVNGLSSNSDSGNEKLNTSLKEMKDSIMAAVVTIFDQVSFIEETEDIKDFVEERTDEINQNIVNITNQLKNFSPSDDLSNDISSIKEQLKLLATSDDDTQGYTYSMQDIETDLAKLRLALKDLQNSKVEINSPELNEISEKLHNITSSVDMLTQDEIKDLKSELSTLKEQTQFLIATSDKSYNVINSGMEDFGQMLNNGISQKVDSISQMLQVSANSDNMIRQSLIYMGEWIDSASESINKISANSEDISKVVNVVSNVENIAEEHQAQLERLEKQLVKFESLEERLEEQQNRIDRLEMSIDKVLCAVENLEDSGFANKIEKIEKQISKLNNNIEKLTSYVE